jgi:hypothetical protein
MADAVADRPDLRGPLRYLGWLARCQQGRVLLGAGYGTAWMVTLALPPYLLSQAHHPPHRRPRDPARS